MKICKSSNNESVTSSRYKVLAVEDDPALVEVLEQLFEISGFEFVILNDVHDIKALVYVHQPDVVLLDYLLPSTNGGNLCEQLRCCGDTAQLPVIIYSAVSKGLLPINEYKCDYFIEKPFDLDYLVSKLTECCTRGK